MLTKETTIKLPDFIRNGRNPYEGKLGDYFDDENLFNLNAYLTYHLHLETTGEEDLDEMLKKIPEDKEIDALIHIYDDPNASIC